MFKGIRKITLLAIVAVATIAFSTASVSARQSGACPTEDACYRQNCDEACVTYVCNPTVCPNPGQIGSRCYVCDDM